VRFDQVSATGLSAGLAARIALRSRSDWTLNGEVLRVEPLADAVTEEMLAKVVFEQMPEPLPPCNGLTGCWGCGGSKIGDRIKIRRNHYTVVGLRAGQCAGDTRRPQSRPRGGNWWLILTVFA
jgi:hypothetical protein